MPYDSTNRSPVGSSVASYDATGTFDAGSGRIITDDEMTSRREGYKLKTKMAVEQGLLKGVKNYTPLEFLMILIGCTQFILAVVNLLLEDFAESLSFLYWVNTAMTLFIGPYLVVQRNKMTDIRLFHETQKAMKTEMDEIKQSNDKINAAFEDLEVTREKLMKFKETLDHIYEYRNADDDRVLEALERSVERKRDTVEKNSHAAHAKLVRIISDIMEYGFEEKNTDNAEIFDEEDVKKFIRRLNALSGITVYEDRIYKQMLNQPMDVCQDILIKLEDEVANEDEILFSVNQDL